MEGKDDNEKFLILRARIRNTISLSVIFSEWTSKDVWLFKWLLVI